MQNNTRNDEGTSVRGARPPMQNDGDATARRQRRQAPTLTPRYRRALLALLKGPRTREDIDRITGASNGPDEVMRLRQQFGLSIPCQRRGGRDMDGHPVEIGIYSLTDSDRVNALKLLEVRT